MLSSWSVFLSTSFPTKVVLVVVNDELWEIIRFLCHAVNFFLCHKTFSKFSLAKIQFLMKLLAVRLDERKLVILGTLVTRDLQQVSGTYLLSQLVTEPGKLFKLPLLSLAIDDDLLLRPLPPMLSLRPVPRAGLMNPPVGKTWRSLTLPERTASRTSSLPVEERGGETVSMLPNVFLKILTGLIATLVSVCRGLLRIRKSDWFYDR